MNNLDTVMDFGSKNLRLGVFNIIPFLDSRGPGQATDNPWILF